MFIQMLRLLDQCGLLLCSSLHLMRESKQWGKWSWQQQHHSVKLLLTSCFPISDQILKAFLGLWMVRFSTLVSWCLLIDCVGWQVHFNRYLQMIHYPTATIDYLHYIALVDNRLLVLFKVYLMCYLQVCSLNHSTESSYLGCLVISSSLWGFKMNELFVLEWLICCGDWFAGLPVVIRLLDPPLHEFLPEGDIDEIVSQLAEATGVDEEEVLTRIEKLSEVNPMLGFRGCR